MTQSGFTLLREKTTDREKENHGERKGDKDGTMERDVRCQAVKNCL